MKSASFIVVFFVHLWPVMSSFSDWTCNRFIWKQSYNLTSWFPPGVALWSHVSAFVSSSLRRECFSVFQLICSYLVILRWFMLLKWERKLPNCSFSVHLMSSDQDSAQGVLFWKSRLTFCLARSSLCSLMMSVIDFQHWRWSRAK